MRRKRYRKQRQHTRSYRSGRRILVNKGVRYYTYKNRVLISIPKNMTTKQFNNLDIDLDGVITRKDCRPFNPKRQDEDLDEFLLAARVPKEKLKEAEKALSVKEPERIVKEEISPKEMVELEEEFAKGQLPVRKGIKFEGMSFLDIQKKELGRQWREEEKIPILDIRDWPTWKHIESPVVKLRVPGIKTKYTDYLIDMEELKPRRIKGKLIPKSRELYLRAMHGESLPLTTKEPLSIPFRRLKYKPWYAAFPEIGKPIPKDFIKELKDIDLEKVKFKPSYKFIPKKKKRKIVKEKIKKEAIIKLPKWFLEKEEKKEERWWK